MDLFKKCTAEFVGTLVLVLFGCGTAVFLNSLGFAAVSLAFGLAVVAMAYSIGNVSGCHINPAISLSMFLTKRLTLKEFLFYVLSQFLGAIAGAAILLLFLKSASINVAASGLGQNGFGTASLLGIEMWGAVVVEIVLTFVFILVVLGVTSKEKYSKCAGLIIGLTLTLIHLLGIPFTGTSVNPARSFGPALLVGGEALAQVWVFIVAPLIGSVLATFFYTFISNKKEACEVLAEEGACDCDCECGCGCHEEKECDCDCHEEESCDCGCHEEECDCDCHEEKECDCGCHSEEEKQD